ncbi:hypothetical protein EZV73_15080 [Acidaminobacter sp. JC074]|uniref:hypothetical protein n=1 Tax=Acidaminobacter sp. JC074 TaxID=2530199 RepID=UPI001F0E92DD|nr:hypothetical protein [Acidaminobacter sp. JC074]MCH4888917.1 hypothetical protein [Acidaminobacter sp. JC074]
MMPFYSSGETDLFKGPVFELLLGLIFICASLLSFFVMRKYRKSNKLIDRIFLNKVELLFTLMGFGLIVKGMIFS